MLRIIFCISCCGAPPTNQAAKLRKLSSTQAIRKKISEEESKSIQAEGQDSSVQKTDSSDKDKLLANQIQSNNDNYGSQKEIEGKSQNTLSGTIVKIDDDDAKSSGRPNESLEGDSITASTSAPSLKRQGAFDLATRTSNTGQDGGDDDGDDADSTPSSIDIEQFTESTNSGNLTRAPRDESFEQQEASPLQQRQSQGAGETVGQIEAAIKESTARSVPSTTKIGDYARIEYSPVDDLESLTTMSQSRGGSERGTTKSQAGSTLSRQNSTTNKSYKSNDGSEMATRSRRSSQGIESTSISIASQLSNEQLQQNLTNMLESVTSPMPMYGTIGLPLGPPLEGTLVGETAKTSPETTGAALTSASQDSLSDSSLGDSPKRPLPTGTTYRSETSPGGNLVGDSIEDSMESSIPIAPLATSESDSGIPSKQPALTEVRQQPIDRVGSPQSFTTTTSGGITNPTPTPSELSGSSTKKRRLKAKSLLKRLKPGSGKKKKNDEVQ